ncbi:alpha-hydroxy acid oxidase [Cupriavidus basilensis]|uniref:Alpha-hydroxy acid oxidase n=1 Tax=Cupriavidus basilensis TaxID=68895 RepID=A0ABT6AQ93_9BURK|nr:alpha-hydroxy acid oxidase [Cupriavidus basilensis]MDF3834799.1 alpha-hydroxy acid oxidase [Cupriavidus basilensis]
MATNAPPSKVLRKVLCLDDFEPLARRHLPPPVFGYIAGAAETNQSYRANRSSFSEYEFIPRALVDISQRSQAASILGQTFAAPFGIAPLGLSALSAYRGDIVLAKAARDARIPMIMSGSSLIRLEEVIKVNPDAWFQAYLPGEERAIVALIERVFAAGFKTLVITVDTPVAANRENNVRAGFSTPIRPSMRLAWQGTSHPRWLFGTFARTLVRHGMPHFENNYATRGAPIVSPTVERDFSDRGHLTWKDVEMIRRIWPGNLVIKGILSKRDASIARDIGANAIVVSNHGGRQLDGAIAPLRVLPEIVAACTEIPVMLDSGIRRGTDVLKAIALGAKFVFVGRPFGYAAAVGGQAGVAHAISLLSAEVSRNMAMLGVNAVSDLRAEDSLYRVNLVDSAHC